MSAKCGHNFKKRPVFYVQPTNHQTIRTNLKRLTRAPCPFALFFRCLVSKLFDVCPRSTLEEMEQQDEVRVAWGTGIAGHVAESGEPVNIPDAYQVGIML